MKRDDLCARHETDLAEIAALDRRFYLDPSPSLAERQAYAARKVRLEELRSRFYAEFAARQQKDVPQFRRCRFIIRQYRHSPTQFY
jgi:hypothetical protein